MEEYLDRLAALKYSRASIDSYKNGLARFSFFLTDHNINRLQDVTAKDLEAYRLELVDKGYSGQSIVLYLRSVRNLFKFLEETRRIFKNPAAGLIIPGARDKLRPVPSEKEMERLLVQPDVTTPPGIRDRAVIETFYGTGVRLGELVGMNIFDVNQKNRIVKVIGKGNKQRVVPLGKKAVFWVTKYIKEVRPGFLKNRPDTRALWLGAQGSRINPLIVQRTISQYGKDAQISRPVTPHSLRRACATHMLAAGAHPVQIQLLLGHSTLSALSSYLKVTVTDMKAMHKKGKPGR